jgi:hypothetical protein
MLRDSRAPTNKPKKTKRRKASRDTPTVRLEHENREVLMDFLQEYGYLFKEASSSTGGS